MSFSFGFLLVLVASEFGAGLDAYREGRYEDALDRFAALVDDAGDDARAEVLYNKALAALRAGKLIEAELAAETAAVRGGPRFYAVRDFLLGSVAFARCARAELESTLPDADPTAFVRAIRFAETTRVLWQRAAVARLDWPEARRNVERVLLKIEELKRRKTEAEKNRRKEKEKKKKKKQPPKPPKLPPPEIPPQLSEPKLRPMSLELSPKQIKLLFDLLREKEKQKVELRRKVRREGKAKVEKDW